MTLKIKTPAAVVIIVVGLAAIIGSIAFAMWYTSTLPDYFYNDKQVLGEKLLEEIRTYDLDNAYPDTAESVLYLNGLLMRMFYGRIVKDEELTRELVLIQRKLLSDYLLDNNPYEAQCDSIIDYSKTIYEKNVYLSSVTVGSVFYSNEVSMCSAPVTQFMINYEKLYWNYFLEQDETGRWKIYSFWRTDKDFINKVTD